MTKKEIDQVFQYDEDTEEDDDELLDIIEPDIWCSYIPKYTQEEEKNAIGYYIDLAGYDFEENEKKRCIISCLPGDKLSPGRNDDRKW